MSTPLSTNSTESGKKGRWTAARFYQGSCCRCVLGSSAPVDAPKVREGVRLGCGGTFRTCRMPAPGTATWSWHERHFGTLETCRHGGSTEILSQVCGGFADEVVCDRGGGGRGPWRARRPRGRRSQESGHARVRV